jgi:sporulation protein YlmC with PRC-barrel domain
MSGPVRHLLGLEVLDRQLVDADDELCGKVDDLELEAAGDGMRVSAILFGPAAWPDRLPPAPAGLARRLLHGPVTRIEWKDVEELSSAVRLKLKARELEERRAELPAPDAGRTRLSFLIGDRVVGPGGRSRGRVYEVEAEEREGGPEATALLVGWAGLLGRLGLKRSFDEETRVPWEAIVQWEGRRLRVE